MSLKVTVLGSGTSHGVPAIGCDCAVCRSSDPRDRRTRPSILIEVQPGSNLSPLNEPAASPPIAAAADSPISAAARSILVDTSTDLRYQALTNNIRRVDTILFTHAHADHIFGLDDVRRFNAIQRTPIGCYGGAETLDSLRRMFAYMFSPTAQIGGGIPQLLLFQIAGPFSMGGVDIVPVPLLHGRLPVLGFRLGPFAYLTDCNRIPDESWPLLNGVHTVILDALRHRPHSTHFTVNEALDVVARLGAKRAYFTHICHDLPHAQTCRELPAGVELAYDGLVVEIA